MFPFKYQLDSLNIVKNGKFFIANKKIEIKVVKNITTVLNPEYCTVKEILEMLKD